MLLAAVVEFIHSATLLHDDIIDGATVRRGRRSVNSRWGNDITVLLGDFLYTKAMSMALSQDNLQVLRLLSDVTLRMIEGQLLEIERDRDLDVSTEATTSTSSGARPRICSPRARASARCSARSATSGSRPSRDSG